MPDRLKIAILGAGAFALTPAVLHDALIEHRLDGLDFALVDADEDVLYPMADLGRRMAARYKGHAPLNPHTTREAALDGAAFIILADPAPTPAADSADRLETDA